MDVVPNDSGREWLALSLGSEEALILLQPGQMLRTVLESNQAWSDQTRFLSRPDGGAGLIAILPQAMGSALLRASAGHPVERELKEIFFDQISENEQPGFQPLP